MIARRLLVSFILCPALILAAYAQQPDSNLTANPSFEEPEGGVGQGPASWMLFTSKINAISLSDRAARTGSQSLKMSAQKLPDAFQGANMFLDVNEEERYSFSAYIIGDREDKIGGSAHGMLVIEWKREDGSEITRTVGPQWEARNLSRLRWEQIQLNKIPVPKGAVKAVFGIHLCDGKQGGKGSIYVDDVIIERN